MRQIISSLFIALLMFLTLERCANPTAITGGERDTIPPTLLEARPKPQTLNVTQQTFNYTFSEPIDADKLQQELLITPTTEIKFTYVIKKDILTLKFEDPFADSTTYTFNFREGVGDATERNSVENFRYAFSTGPFIDSLSIEGKVLNTTRNQGEYDFLVGLYLLSDTLLTTEVKPYYFYNTDKSGSFTIENIKAGSYLLFTYKDANNNLLFNPKDEPFGVYPDTLNIDVNKNLDSLVINTVSLNAEKLRMISARPSGNQFQIRYSKPITPILLNIDSKYEKEVFPQLSTDKTEILVYKSKSLEFSEQDSIPLIIQVRDTLYQNQIDTVFAKFIETQRNPKDLSFSVNSLRSVRDKLIFNVKSSKPLQSIDPDKLSITVDTLINIIPDTLSISPLPGFSGDYIVEIPINIKRLEDSANQLLPDSLSLNINESLKLTLSTSSILSIESDTLPKNLTMDLVKDKSDDLGTLNLIVETEKESFELRLINKKGEIIRTSINEKMITFNDLLPDTYNIEVYIDTNNNGTWEVANPWKNTTSEEIYKYPVATELKANWIVDIEDINF